MEQENAAASVSFAVLKNQPGWARVQERLSASRVRQLRKAAQPANLQSRSDAALKNFTFTARTYLDLVSDSETADAFCNLLPLIVREAYVRYCGQPPQLVQPTSEEAHRFERDIELRFREWTAKAYRRVATPAQLDPPKKRGRPTRFTLQQLRQADEMKRAGETNNEIAKILYRTKTPTPEQRRSVPTELKHHFRSKK
jgi:hypothetical protein